MTTKIMIDSHAGWPVQVETITIDPITGERVTTSEKIPPNSVRDYYIFDNQELHFKELRL